MGVGVGVSVGDFICCLVFSCACKGLHAGLLP